MDLLVSGSEDKKCLLSVNECEEWIVCVTKIFWVAVLNVLRPKLHGYTGCKRMYSVEQAVS